MNKIKPCPFCGEKVTASKGSIGITAYITFFKCHKCGAVVSFNGAEAKSPVIIQWNRRANVHE